MATAADDLIRALTLTLRERTGSEASLHELRYQAGSSQSAEWTLTLADGTRGTLRLILTGDRHGAELGRR